MNKKVPEDDYVLEEQVGHLLRRAHQRASAIFTDLIGKDGLTPVQYAALVKIRDLGNVTQNHLGRLIATDPATINGVVSRLEERSLIARQQDPENRRRVLWRLTPEGTTLVDRVIPVGERISRETLSPLSEEERAVFLEFLHRLK
ncbi:MAG: MarR family transcriptional regulator [Alphaproteobacteria bacterium]|nr:MarR family transcriptional regulator [Alphaproteobacteria bacterium]MCY4495729.1 MarR family transcriptional regulator [Rhodospirillaceae bacterium]